MKFLNSHAIKNSQVLVILLFSLVTFAKSAYHHECSREQKVTPKFDPSHPDDLELDPSATFPWPTNINEPITFTLKYENDTYSKNHRVFVQIALNVNRSWSLSETIPPDDIAKKFYNSTVDLISSDLFRLLEKGSLTNCFIDRSTRNPCQAARRNPRCCYDLKAKLKGLPEVYPSCPSRSGCYEFVIDGHSVVKRPCQAVCFYDLIIQVEFFLGREYTGGKTVISAIYKKARLSQKEEGNDSGFIVLNQVDKNSTYTPIDAQVLGSPLSSKIKMGFWIRWKPAGENIGPFLEVGREAEDLPYLIHDFSKNCFDCEEKDNFGWHGIDLQIPQLRKIFSPKYWKIDGIQGMGDIMVGSDCKNVIYTRYQPQKWLDSPCIEQNQCVQWCNDPSCLGRHCKKEKDEDLPSWLATKTCQIEPFMTIPTEISILLGLVGLIGVFIVPFFLCCCFHLGFVLKANDDFTEYEINLNSPTTVKYD